jgi:hypothetical protein
MRIGLYILLWIAMIPAAWGRVLLRWTQPEVPPVREVGVAQLVISRNSSSASFLERARAQGYRVYVQVTPEEVPQVTSATRKLIAGIIVEIPASRQATADATLAKLRATYSGLNILFLDPNGKQPQMKGTMVVKREGVLEITSPTAQPWLDSNVPLVRFEQGFRPMQVPLYTFAWEASDRLQQKQGPTMDEYALAIAEANALHADLILNIPEELQKQLMEKNDAAWKLWNKLKRNLQFSPTPGRSHPEANIGVIASDYDSGYEPMNLMARHNMPFRVVPLAKLTAESLAGLRVLLLFAAPNAQSAKLISEFAAKGGIVVTVALSGSFPWQTAPARHEAEHSNAYIIGKGSVIELSEPVSDPETFAQDIRRLMSGHDVLLSVWNALTTIGIPYRDSRTGATVLELVNYSGEPLRVQARVKGSFQRVRLEKPENGCCQTINPVQRDGFTEFVIPQLLMSARVHLQAESESH